MLLFGAKRGSIFIVDEKNNDLVMTSAQGLDADGFETIVKHMGEGIVGRVASLRQPVFVEDIDSDPRFVKRGLRSRYKTPSFICAPMLIKDVVIGVINITDKETGRRFDKNEMRLLDFLASQIALNYRRTQLYEQFKSVVKETRTLKDRLGQSDQETAQLKQQVVIHEKLATIGKLAGGIAHEFNNPLDGVIRYTNLCLDAVHDDVVRGYLLEIKQGLHRMANIVKSLLACSRNDSLSREKIAFSRALERVLSFHDSAIDAKNIIIVKHVADDIPSIDDLGIERVLANLIRNAVDAMSSGGTITISAQYEAKQIIFSVADTGCGIPREHLSTIFEPFFTTKDIEKGCGLGLTIVDEIVKSYDGKIDVVSVPNKGTTFIVTLPVKE